MIISIAGDINVQRRGLNNFKLSGIDALFRRFLFFNAIRAFDDAFHFDIVSRESNLIRKKKKKNEIPTLALQRVFAVLTVCSYASSLSGTFVYSITQRRYDTRRIKN